MTPALLISMLSGRSPQPVANEATVPRSERSTIPTLTRSSPSSPLICAAAASPAALLRTAMTTSAPAPASARTVSMPMPVAPPVTMAVWPERSLPSSTTAASV